MSNEIQFLLYSMPDSEGKVQVFIGVSDDLVKSEERNRE